MCRGCGRDRLIKPYGLDCIYWMEVSANTFALYSPTDVRKLVGHGDHELNSAAGNGCVQFPHRKCALLRTPRRETSTLAQ